MLRHLSEDLVTTYIYIHIFSFPGNPSWGLFSVVSLWVLGIYLVFGESYAIDERVFVVVGFFREERKGERR